MENITEVLKIIERHKALVNSMGSLYANGYTSALKDLETEVKKLNIPVVVGRSEQLFCEEPEKATYRELHFNKCDVCGRPIKQTK